MRTTCNLLTTLSIGMFLCAVAVRAEDGSGQPDLSGEVELGGIGVSTNSGLFKRYTGLSEGKHVLGNLNLRYVDPEDADHARVIGRDLGLSARSIMFEGGRQGKVEVDGYYYKLPTFEADDAETPFFGRGHGNLTLPGGFRKAPTTREMNLHPFLKDFDLKTEREGGGVGVSVYPSRNTKLRSRR